MQIRRAQISCRRASRATHAIPQTMPAGSFEAACGAAQRHCRKGYHVDAREHACAACIDTLDIKMAGRQDRQPSSFMIISRQMGRSSI